MGFYVVGDPIATTSASGQFTLTGLDSGTYAIRVKPAIGWRQTAPTTNTLVTLTNGSVVSNLLFGEQKVK